jgi:uncharacterized protein (DUF433 family)
MESGTADEMSLQDIPDAYPDLERENISAVLLSTVA